jgi:hypothetical protein
MIENAQVQILESRLENERRKNERLMHQLTAALGWLEQIAGDCRTVECDSEHAAAWVRMERAANMGDDERCQNRKLHEGSAGVASA